MKKMPLCGIFVTSTCDVHFCWFFIMMPWQIFNVVNSCTGWQAGCREGKLCFTNKMPSVQPKIMDTKHHHLGYFDPYINTDQQLNSMVRYSNYQHYQYIILYLKCQIYFNIMVEVGWHLLLQFFEARYRWWAFHWWKDTAWKCSSWIVS